MLCRPFTATVASYFLSSGVVPRCNMASQLNQSVKVNLLDLASAVVACTVTASHSICRISAHHNGNGDNAKNTRLKPDGSFVTDADFKAQGVIVQAIRSVSDGVRIVGEESEEEMASHIEEDFLDADVLARTRQEIFMRVNRQQSDHFPLSAASLGTPPTSVTFDVGAEVDISRVSVIVDPLDGTKSYANGDYDSVSILIGIVVDNVPIFGVVGKPFNYTGLLPILNTTCVAIYGGSLCDGVFVAGRKDPVTRTPIDSSASLVDLPRAVISTSRSKGVVHDFCIHLGEKGLVYPEPMMCSGAGEKSLRLILQRKNEALWFFPKAGTSLWDVAAPDALLRALGGKMSDKYGNEMDYSKSREEAENVNGVVACIDAELHQKCIKLFQEGDWDDRST